MNTFCYKRINRRWTWKSPDGTTNNDIDFALGDDVATVPDVELLCKIESSEYGMVR